MTDFPIYKNDLDTLILKNALLASDLREMKSQRDAIAEALRKAHDMLAQLHKEGGNDIADWASSVAFIGEGIRAALAKLKD